ncbi:uncharacterized protein si:ch211-63p21.8 isoform X2 [Platichthys flesus]|uniref:uncharacterized protein si:ch211-63p21.8 isoform X2 n=1 Tax=Platichthys flesus TaxID=8260 RepID=UPI002DBE524E|nr:uncharacterized protein si:ch211-63p21.8 isoform X2 [Platichthys flesus]
MVVVTLHLQQEWEEWKKSMEKKRRRTLSERLSRWTNLEEQEEEDDGEETEEDSEEEEENEACWTGKGEEGSEKEGEGEKKVKLTVLVNDEKVTEEEEEEKENEGETEFEEDKQVDVEEEREVTEEMEGGKKGEVEEVTIAEQQEKVGECEEVSEEVNLGMMMEPEEIEEEIKEKREQNGETEAEEQEVGGEGSDNGEDREDKGRREVKEEEEKEVTQAEIVGIGNGREAEEMIRREGGLIEAELWEEEGEVEEAIEPVVNKEVEEDGKEKEEEQVQEEEDGSRIEKERLQQNQECAAQTLKDEENFSDSSESDEDSRRLGSEDEGYNSEKLNNGKRDVEKQRKDPEEVEEPKRNDSRVLGVWTEEEDQNKKLTNEEDSFTGSRGGFEEEQDLLEEQDNSSDEEEADHISHKDMDCKDEDEGKVYCRDDYSTDLFLTLTEFRDSSLLTDLHLSTEAGQSFQVHSPVLAAVSSLVRESLSRRNTENNKREDDTRWSISLGPEVDAVGLEAVVEFAYSGFMSRLNKDTVNRIKGAAQTLCVPRVMHLCNKEESPKTGGIKKEEKISAAEERKISLQSIKQLWMDRVGCDVTLEGIGASLPVHRVILAAGSDYFHGMFTSGMRESHQPRVALPSLLASEMELLVGCSYSGALPLSWSFVFEITSTTLQLQYQPALSLCLDFLQGEINPLSCLDVASFAVAYEMVQLLESADDFVLRQFQKEFNEVQSLDIWTHHSLVELYEAIFEEFCSNEVTPESQCRIYLPKESLVLIGGEQTSEDLSTRSISRELWFGNSLRSHTGIKKAMEWRRLGELPESARFSHEVAVLTGQLYVFGGKKYYGTDDTLTSVYRYDPHQNSWERLADMQQNRCLFSVVVLEGKMFSIGGHCDPEYIESVERYCPTSNSWSFTWPLDLPLSGHVAKVVQGQILVSGGMNSDYRCLSSIFRYHPETGSTYLANMNKPRAKHCMESLGDRLYVAGGTTAGAPVNVVDMLDCEVYNPETDSWTAITSLPVPHVGAGSAVLEGKFYVLGGYSHEEYSDTNMVHRYDPTTQRWENMGKMPGPNNDIRASLLVLPPDLRL